MPPGVFTISLDTELGWGTFDRGGLDTYRQSYLQTPSLVRELCSLFDSHDVSATWAVVAHLLEDCGGRHADGETSEQSSPTDLSDSRRAWLADAPCSRGSDRRLWYAPEMIESIVDCDTAQDVGVHGYSHLVFADHDAEAARAELRDATETLEAFGIDPRSLVYPRNRIAHTDVLGDYDIDVYRGVDARWYERRSLPFGRGPLRFLDEAATVTPPTAVPFHDDGVVCVPGSQMFRPRDGLWSYTPEDAGVTRAKRGLDRAAERGEVFHLWFHPFNLGSDPETLLSGLEEILVHARKLRRADRLEVHSMRGVAELFRAGHWDRSGERT